MKNLKVRSITFEKDQVIYVSYQQVLNTPIFNDVFFWGIQGSNLLKYVVEYSSKQAQAKFITSRQPHFEKDEVIVSDGLAKKLGIKLGDKVNLKIKIFGKPSMGYLGLYEKQPKKFNKYFDKQNLNEKKRILKELLEYDTINDEAIKWLDKKYPELIKEVGIE